MLLSMAMILLLLKGKSFPYVYQWSRITWAKGHIVNWIKYIIVFLTSHRKSCKEHFQNVSNILSDQMIYVTLGRL